MTKNIFLPYFALKVFLAKRYLQREFHCAAFFPVVKRLRVQICLWENGLSSRKVNLPLEPGLS